MLIVISHVTALVIAAAVNAGDMRLPVFLSLIVLQLCALNERTEGNLMQ